MRVQRVLIPGVRVESWTVLSDDGVPVEPVEPLQITEGRWARAESFRSAWKCSMMAWPRWVLSAATVSMSAGSVVVKKACRRPTTNAPDLTTEQPRCETRGTQRGTPRQTGRAITHIRSRRQPAAPITTDYSPRARVRTLQRPPRQQPHLHPGPPPPPAFRPRRQPLRPPPKPLARQLQRCAGRTPRMARGAGTRSPSSRGGAHAARWRLGPCCAKVSSIVVGGPEVSPMVRPKLLGQEPTV